MNIQQSRSLGSDVYEFKAGAQRLLYFYTPGRRTVVTHGLAKGDPLAPELQRTIRLRAEFLAEESEEGG